MTQSNFCSRPFNELTIDVNGTVSPCCVMFGREYKSITDYLQSPFLQKLRQDLNNNIQHTACNVCWRDEKIGAWSNRISNSVENNNVIKEAHLKFSNKCNFKCRMCSPYLSSSIGIENNIKNPIISAFSNTEIKKNFYKEILPNLDVLTMSGGEPLLSDDHLEFLKWGYKINPNLKLIYNSNMSTIVYKGIDLQELWRKYKSVSIIVSLDALDDAGEYQRFGLKSKKIIQNMNKAYEFIDYVHVTVSIYTIFSLPKLINWCINNNIEIRFFYVGQVYLNPVSLPKDIKLNIINLFKSLENVSDKLQLEIRDSLLKPLLSNVKDIQTLNIEFKNHTERLDKIRNQSFIKVVPELKNWYLAIKEN
tara:strand:- start:2862 stop:3950 length:1089 start_codon:yes stop_codon:yes gene_type:complete